MRNLAGALRASALVAASALGSCTAPPPQHLEQEFLLERDLADVRGVLERTLKNLDLVVVSTGTRPGMLEVRAATASGAELVVTLEQVTARATQVEVLAPDNKHYASWLAGKLMEQLTDGVNALPRSGPSQAHALSPEVRYRLVQLGYLSAPADGADEQR
jgi:hypothetical protein